MLSVRIAVVTVHGERTQVLARVKEPDLVEFWYAEILHGTIPLPWLGAWVTSLAPGSPARFDGVVLSSGPRGEVLLSIPPEIIDHPLTVDQVTRLMGG
ncbi:hypothetical protein KIH74_13410 [Kineosporia sp. J2-2]|uniref:Uncharacterized protein n=1 Tax=Kineosporia corallincola TaxID=2835133 RepID=A0ABS5TK25_9ACTN|nr:hypothetical protein [Kineosporia corallincola]MBT0769929.1 hypothetical protein [Kineosporia corallincola]